MKDSKFKNSWQNHVLYGIIITVEPALAVTSLIQPHPVGPKQPQCIYYGMQPG